MPSSISFKKISETKFSFPFRMLLSGSSECGKTFFAEKLLKHNDLFLEKIEYVSYHYPCELLEPPVEWHNSLDIPVNYKIGLPTMNEIMEFPEKTCIVLDDLFDEVVKSKEMDHLFRVISSKRKLSIIVMTQYIFASGSNGISRQIRNNSNFTVLFRNCADVNMNKRASQQLGVSQAYQAAARAINTKKYPYFFIDQSPKGVIGAHQLYIDIFSKFQVVYNNYAMKGYIIKEQDFKQILQITEKNKAVLKNENKSKKVRKEKRKKLKRRTDGQGLEGNIYEDQKLSKLQSEDQ